jgi:hypothetical protein
MARLARVVAEGVPHHVTQRGNARQFLLNTDADRMVYLDLLRQAVQLFPISIIGDRRQTGRFLIRINSFDSSIFNFGNSGDYGNFFHFFLGRPLLGRALAKTPARRICSSVNCGYAFLISRGSMPELSMFPMVCTGIFVPFTKGLPPR